MPVAGVPMSTIEGMQYEILDHGDFQGRFFTASQLKKQAFDGFLAGTDLIRAKGSTEPARPASKYKELREQFDHDENFCNALKSKDTKGRLLALAKSSDGLCRSVTTRAICAVVACSDEDATVRGYARSFLHAAGDLRAMRYSEILEHRFHPKAASDKSGKVLVTVMRVLLSLAPAAARARAAVFFATRFPHDEVSDVREFAKLTEVENDDRFWLMIAERIIEVGTQDNYNSYSISLENCPVARLDLLCSSARRQLLATSELTLDVSRVAEFPSFFSKAKAVRLTLKNCFWDALHEPIYDMHLSHLTIDGGRFARRRLFLAEQEGGEEDWFDKSNGFQLVLKNVESFTEDSFSQRCLDDQSTDLYTGIQFDIDLQNCGLVKIPKRLNMKSLEIDSCSLIGGDETEAVFWESLHKNESRLELLSIRYCGLRNFPCNSLMGFASDTGIKVIKLDLSNNLISKWAEETDESDFQWASEIESICLNDNQLTTIPASIRHLSSLKELSMNSNHLECLPEWTTRLLKLEVNFNALIALPSGDWSQLVSLDVSHNPLKGLPSEIFRPSLTSLDCSDTKLTELPNTLCRALGIELLRISRCPLQDLPKCGWPRTLTLLELDEVNVGNFPVSVLETLSHLSLNGTSISGLSMLPGVLQLSPFRSDQAENELSIYASKSSIHLLLDHVIARLNVLNLEDCDLTEVPESIKRFPNLRWLSLGSNRIQVIPSWLGLCQRLNSLDLSSNPINSIESEFSGIGTLETLHLSHCNLTKGAHLIGLCSSLSNLRIESGIVSGSVDWLENLKNLEYVSFSNLQFDGFGKQVKPHPNLKTFELNGASIDCLPNWIFSSPLLEKFDFSGTQVREFPSQLWQSKSIQSISLPKYIIGLNYEKLALMPNLAYISIDSKQQVDPIEIHFLSPFIDWN